MTPRPSGGVFALLCTLTAPACQSLPERMAELEPAYAYYYNVPTDDGAFAPSGSPICETLVPTGALSEAYAANGDWSLGVGVQYSIDDVCAADPKPLTWELTGEEPRLVVADNVGLKPVPVCDTYDVYEKPHRGGSEIYVATRGVVTASVDAKNQLELTLSGVQVKPSEGGEAVALPDLEWELPLTFDVMCDVPAF